MTRSIHAFPERDTRDRAIAAVGPGTNLAMALCATREVRDIRRIRRDELHLLPQRFRRLLSPPTDRTGIVSLVFENCAKSFPGDPSYAHPARIRLDARGLRRGLTMRSSCHIVGFSDTIEVRRVERWIHDDSFLQL